MSRCRDVEIHTVHNPRVPADILTQRHDRRERPFRLAIISFDVVDDTPSKKRAKHVIVLQKRVIGLEERGRIEDLLPRRRNDLRIPRHVPRRVHRTRRRLFLFLINRTLPQPLDPPLVAVPTRSTTGYVTSARRVGAIAADGDTHSDPQCPPDDAGGEKLPC
jgi:hypothetical protein